MTPEIIAGETIERNGNDCYITTMVVLLKMGCTYILLVTYCVRGWCTDDTTQIKWTGSDKEEGLKQYNNLVKEISK